MIIDILEHYYERFKLKYGANTSQDQWSALNAMLGCRSGQYGNIAVHCDQCNLTELKPQSCGHRSCQRCQHFATVQWLERQSQKLLPVSYFMVTFTLPAQLRALAKSYPSDVYSMMFRLASSTLKSFGLNDKKLSGELGMTGVLHTHSRRLDYHPHIHFIVPNGAFDKTQRFWNKKKGAFLFKQQNLAKVFRARLLDALTQEGFHCPTTPKAWVVDCKKVGSGLPALKYLSKYLYRGVIGNKQLVHDDGTKVTFSYIDSNTGKKQQRTLPGEDFIALLLQHILPKGLRRVRDYGFLHGNARKTLKMLQMVLRAKVPVQTSTPRPSFHCKVCRQAMKIIGFIPARPVYGPG